MLQKFGIIKIIDNLKGEPFLFSFDEESDEEKERGIRDIQKIFCVVGRDKSPGIEGRRIKEIPAELQFFENDDITSITFSLELREKNHFKWLEERFLLEELETEELVTWWNEREFSISSKKQTAREKIRILWNEFNKKNVALGLGFSRVLRPASFKILIIDNVPKNILEEIKKADKKKYRLTKKAKKLRIENLLRKKGKNVLAIYPRWTNKSEKRKTRYDLMYWINPTNKEKYKEGWYSVEEIKNWAVNDSGPITTK